MPEDVHIPGVEPMADEEDRAEPLEADVKGAVPQRYSRAVWQALGFGAVAAVSVASVAGWLGYQTYQSRHVDQQRELFLRVGRQGAVNLTTISDTDADADIRRILDSSTGEYHEDMQRSSQPYVDLVKREHSKSAGTVTEAGLESVAGDSASRAGIRGSENDNCCRPRTASE